MAEASAPVLSVRCGLATDALAWRDPRRVAAAAVLATLTGLFALVIIRAAWVGDDAFITFRTIDNFLHDHGLRWNVDERVQSFTHPLWLFLLTPFVGLTGNPFLTAIITSLVLTSAAVGLVLASVRRQILIAIFILTAMTLSKAFTDYATSGLENALSHLLLAILMTMVATPTDRPRRALAIGVVVGLLGLTRMDLLVLGGPIGLAALRRPRATWPQFLLGCAPLLAWEIFSVIYYGVPFPNTAYAKIGTAIPHADLFRQGLTYFADSLDRDPVTLFVIGAAMALALSTRGLRIVALALLLYLTYVVRIGGDFMSGRFFTAPFLLSMFVFGRAAESMSTAAKLTAIVVAGALGFGAVAPTVFNDSRYEMPWAEIYATSGLVDERGLYFQNSGWLSASGFRSGLGAEAEILAKVAKAKAASPVAFTHDRVGMVGYLTGPDRHIIDVFALNDPLLARLPANIPWRIGHFSRDLPAGYLESVVADRNLVEDPKIASLYEVIREVTRGPIWSARRWRAIVALNLGRTDGWPVTSR